MNLDEIKALGLKIAEIGAPIVGTALGGPLGGTIAGTIVGSLADALGCPPTPADVTQAIQANPEQGAAAAAQVEADHKDQLLEILNTVNDTARVELASDDKFVRWARPSAIWVVSAASGSYFACIMAAMIGFLLTKDTSALTLLLGNAGNISIALTPVGAVAGVTAWWRSQEKIRGVAK